MENKVEVIAPASWSKKVDINMIKSFLKENNFDYNFPENTYDEHHQYFSNSDQIRFELFKNAIEAEDSNIIWCIRGGYGSAKIIPLLSKIDIPNIQKTFIGFSDITALNIFLTQEWGWKAIHGPMLNGCSTNEINENSVNNLVQYLHGNLDYDLYLKDLLSKAIPLNQEAKDTDINSISNKIIGGNLTLIQTSIGTIWQLNSENKLLFLEDVNENGYKIDRNLNHLIQASIMDNINGVLFGDFSSNDSNELPIIEYALNKFANEMNFPVYRIEGIGHQSNNDFIIFS